MGTGYPAISEVVLSMPLPSCCMYLYEAVCLELMIIKSKCQSTLKNVGDALHPATPNIHPRSDFFYVKISTRLSHLCANFLPSLINWWNDMYATTFKIRLLLIVNRYFICMSVSKDQDHIQFSQVKRELWVENFNYFFLFIWVTTHVKRPEDNFYNMSSKGQTQWHMPLSAKCLSNLIGMPILCTY